MTKVSVFGEPEEKEKKLKPIRLVKLLDIKYKFVDDNESEGFDEIMLLEKKYGDYDLIWCFTKGKGGILYLGHWNDGVV